MARMGRPPGSKSYKTQQWERFAEWFLTVGAEKLNVEMNKLEGKEFITHFKDLLEYFEPKLARNEHSGPDGESLPQPILNVLCNNGHKESSSDDKKD